MSLKTKLVDRSPELWYHPDFQAVLEDHMTYLRPRSSIMYSDPHALVKYRFDMFSFFRHHGLIDTQHWTTMRLNGFYAQTDDFSHLTHFLVPSERELNRILQQFNSRNR